MNVNKLVKQLLNLPCWYYGIIPNQTKEIDDEDLIEGYDGSAEVNHYV